MPHAVSSRTPLSIMKIVSIEQASGPDDRVRLRLESGEEVELAREVALTGAVGVGDEVQPARIEELADEDLRWRVRDTALQSSASKAHGLALASSESQRAIHSAVCISMTRTR